MTNPSTHINTHIAPAAWPKTERTLSPTSSALPLGEVPPNDNQDDDDSTIKCICGFQHDDGSSVQCDRCQTWQHTGCYYYDEVRDRVPLQDELTAIDHLCADCGPRPINVQAAVNRQRARLGDFLHDDKKTKKPPSKSHKKKPKVPETNGVLTNGWSTDADGHHDGTSRSPRDPLPSTKKSKTNHRSSHSINVPGTLPYPVPYPHTRSGSAMESPMKPPAKSNFNKSTKELYSEDFMHLYDNDPGEQDMQANTFSDLNILQDLSNWAHDPDALTDATHGFGHAEVFHRIDQPLESIIGPPPLKQHREDQSITKDNRHPRWIYLTSEGMTKQNSVVGELKGKIGHMRDYISHRENQWDWLRHPAPFVFFHPKLPLYIDTRSEGNICRYLRRSCTPNLSMSTFLINHNDYHFCFIAKQDIQPGEELTIGWVLDEHMRKLCSNKNGMAQDLSPESEQYFIDWVSKVSPEFGGCACDMPDYCWFVRYGPASIASGRGNVGHSKRRQHPSTLDISDGEDAKSTSRSNSGSRDLTPIGHNSNGFGLGLEISEREKRKIAAADKNKDFDKQPGAKKKKRNSGGSNANTPGFPSSVRDLPKSICCEGTNAAIQKQPGHTSTSFSQPNTPSFLPKPQYADASTSRRKSGSPTSKGPNGSARPRNSGPIAAKKRSSLPNTPTVPSPLARPNYVDGATQTDMDDQDDWYKPPQSLPRPRKPYMSLTKRLLLRSQHDRQKMDERKRSIENSPAQQFSVIQSGHAIANMHISPTQEDVEMQNADHPQERSESMQAPDRHQHTSLSSNSPELKPPPRPPSDQHALTNGYPPPDTHVHLPSKPNQSSDSSSSTPLTQTPTSIVPASPFTQPSSSYPPASLLTSSSTGHIQPSPAKKKVSLSDYMKRKASHSTADTKQASGSPEMSHTPLKPPLTAPVGSKHMEGSVAVDTPAREKKDSLGSSAEGNKATVILPIPEEKPAG